MGFYNKNNTILCVELPKLVCSIEKCKDDVQVNHRTFHRIGDKVPISHQPSLETFLRDFLTPQLPVKITGNV